MTDELSSTTIEETATLKNLKGISVYPGTAFGLCQIFSAGDLEVPQFSIEKNATRGEIQRLRAAINTVDKQLAGLAESFDDDIPPEAEAFVEVHRTILRDRVLIEDTIEIIK
ncbi:Phosphoenolpyruvate synthase/pyruvate phosphate dikinase, partial [gut metagenome]